MGIDTAVVEIETRLDGDVANTSRTSIAGGCHAKCAARSRSRPGTDTTLDEVRDVHFERARRGVCIRSCCRGGGERRPLPDRPCSEPRPDAVAHASCRPQLVHQTMCGGSGNGSSGHGMMRGRCGGSLSSWFRVRFASGWVRPYSGFQWCLTTAPQNVAQQASCHTVLAARPSVLAACDRSNLA